MRLTLDSNIVIDAFEGRDPDALALINLHPERVTLRVATRTTDREATSWLGALAERGIGVVSSVMRLDVSLWGSDVLGGDSITENSERVQAIVFPQGVGTGRDMLGRLSDVDVIEAHMRSGGDALVTRDEHDILPAAPKLLTELGVQVLRAAEALELIERSASE